VKYKNASDVLPEELLKEVQKYASGETLYFPKNTERIQWGVNSGSRSFFRQRNEEICRKYASKASIERLADEYCLSVERIRKIVFGSKN
jgi:Mor family transcriptional regulator